MPKKGRKLSDEQKAKMKAGREAAKLKKQQLDKDLPDPQVADKTPETPVTPNNSEQQPVNATDLLLQKLMAEIEELKKQKNPEMTPEAALQYTAQMQGQPVVGKNGIQGKMFRYPVEKSYYPNPIERLYDEPTLSRFNLRENYFFDWEVEGIEYEKYGVTYAEPKFTVRIFRKLYGEDGMPNGKYALINRQVQHEDEVVARAAADKLGITDEFEDFQAMMNEMRYMRIRQWLLDLFKPPQVTTHNQVPTQQVIDGKVVEVFDTEALIDGESGISKAGSINREVRI